MPTTYYRCKNRSCEKAKTRETIEIGDKSRFTCPSGEANCQREHLREVDAPAGGGIPKPVLIGGGALIGLLAIVGAVLFLLPSGEPNPADAEAAVTKELQEVWPWLKP
jgi:hypothetical protein